MDSFFKEATRNDNKDTHRQLPTPESPVQLPTTVTAAVNSSRRNKHPTTRRAHLKDTRQTIYSKPSKAILNTISGPEMRDRVCKFYMKSKRTEDIEDGIEEVAGIVRHGSQKQVKGPALKGDQQYGMHDRLDPSSQHDEDVDMEKVRPPMKICHSRTEYEDAMEVWRFNIGFSGVNGHLVKHYSEPVLR